MGDVLRFPSALTARSERVDQLCDAVVTGKAVRPLVDAEEVDGSVKLTVGDVEVWASAEDALAIANRISTAAGDAIARRKGTR